MLNNIDFFRARLSARFNSTDTVMRLVAGGGVLDALNKLPIGDHVFFHITYRNRRETVRYTHHQPLVLHGSEVLLPVERGQHDTVVTSWSAGTCVGSELTKAILDDWWREKNCNC